MNKSNWLNEVLIYDKIEDEHKVKQIFRKYLSFGKIPEIDLHHKKSYMFKGSKEQNIKEIPKAYKKYVKNIIILDDRYNQFIINYYKDGNDYIEPHSDCDKDMIQNYKILILSLGTERTLRFTTRNQDIKGSFDVILKHNSYFILNEFLNKQFRHEIIKDVKILTDRISITARMMKE